MACPITYGGHKLLYFVLHDVFVYYRPVVNTLCLSFYGLASLVDPFVC